MILTSDHGCDPTTPSTDHSREHALLLAYVEGRNAAGRIHNGEFGDVGATVNAWLGGKQPGTGHAGRADRRAVSDVPRDLRLDNPLLVRWEFASEERLATRNSLTRQLIEGDNPEQFVFEEVAKAKPKDVLEVGAGAGEMSERIARELGAKVVALDNSERMVALTRETRRRSRARGRCRAAVRGRELRLRRRGLDLLPRVQPRSGDRRMRARAPPGWPPHRRDPLRRESQLTCGSSSARRSSAP